MVQMPEYASEVNLKRGTGVINKAESSSLLIGYKSLCMLMSW